MCPVFLWTALWTYAKAPWPILSYSWKSEMTKIGFYTWSSWFLILVLYLSVVALSNFSFNAAIYCLSFSLTFFIVSRNFFLLLAFDGLTCILAVLGFCPNFNSWRVLFRVTLPPILIAVWEEFIRRTSLDLLVLAEVNSCLTTLLFLEAVYVLLLL